MVYPIIPGHVWSLSPQFISDELTLVSGTPFQPNAVLIMVLNDRAHFTCENQSSFKKGTCSVNFSHSLMQSEISSVSIDQACPMKKIPAFAEKAVNSDTTRMARTFANATP